MVEYKVSQRLWDGIRKSVDMKKLAEYRTETERVEALKRMLKEGDGYQIKNLSKMKDENFKRVVYSHAIARLTTDAKKTVEKLKPLERPTPPEIKRLAKAERIISSTTETAKRAIPKAQKTIRDFERKKEIASVLREKKKEIFYKYKRPKTVSQGRQQLKKHYQFEFKRATITGKTRKFQILGKGITKGNVEFYLRSVRGFKKRQLVSKQGRILGWVAFE